MSQVIGSPGIPTKTTNKELLIEKMRHDDELFCRKVLPEFFPCEFQFFHKEAIADINTGFPQVSFVFPRDCGKTTLLQGKTLKKLAFSEFSYGLIMGESEEQAAENLSTIMDVVEFDERFIYYFGELKSPRKWKDTQAEFRHPVTHRLTKLLCRGSGQRVRGFKKGSRRVDWAWADDFESEINTATKELRAKVARWMYGSVAPTVKKATSWDPIPGQLILTGTVPHFDSYLMKTTRSKHWKSRIYSLIMPDGRLLWPDKYNQQYIDDKEDQAIEEGTLDDFYREYLSQPVNPKSSFILPTEIRHYEMEVVKVGGKWCLRMGAQLIPLAVYIGTDLALGRKNSDDSCVLVIGMTPKGHVYVLEMIAGKYSVGQTIEIIFDMVTKWHPRKVGMENAGTQGTAIEWMQAEKRRQDISFNLVPVDIGTTESKAARLITTIQPYYRAGKIHTREDEHRDLDQEALDFRPTKRDNRDNRLDSLFIAIKVARPHEDIELTDDGEEVQTERFRAPHPMTL